MKHLDEFRDPVLAGRMFDEIHRITTRPWAIMEAFRRGYDFVKKA